MSLASVIQHKCVGAPTYLDVLPGDVIQYCIMPFLGWEDRIHVNMLTPAGDRTLPNKISKERIIANQLMTSTQKLMLLIKKVFDLKLHRDNHLARGSKHGPSKTKFVQEIIHFLYYILEPQNSILVQYNSNFRNIVSSKIAEFSNPANIAQIPRIYLRKQMAEVVLKLTEMLTSLPYIQQITAARYLSATVWQNEIALLNEWWIPGIGVVRRYQGDIYMEME